MGQRAEKQRAWCFVWSGSEVRFFALIALLCALLSPLPAQAGICVCEGGGEPQPVEPYTVWLPLAMRSIDPPPKQGRADEEDKKASGIVSIRSSGIVPFSAEQFRGREGRVA